MATLKIGICPSCGKERELAFFHFGVVKSTMCVYCLKRYLDVSVIPRFLKNNDTSDDDFIIGVIEDEK